MRRTGSAGADVSGQPQRRAGGFVSIGVVLALTGALVATVLGAGAFSRTLDVSDGNIWLWSSKPAQVSRVNSNSGRVDQNQPLTDSRGHHVQITQNDKYLLLHDLDTGKITSVDLRRMGFTGSLDVGTKSDYVVALTGNTAALVDMTKGIVRGLDPATLHETKARLQLPGPLVGGEFDAHGALWLGIPSQGTVVSVDVGGTAASVTRTEAALSPGHSMAMSVLDGGALAVDKDGNRLALVTDKVHDLASPYPLSGAVLPARTVGSLSAVTLPSAGRVVTVDGDGDQARVGSFALAPGTTPGAATPFSGRIYVPDAKQHTVLVYDATGHRDDSLGLAGAQGPLELEVREGHLMINAPDSSVARVVDPNGVTRIVDKYQSNLAGNNGDLAVIAAPAPQSSAKNPNPGNGRTEPNPGNQQQTGPPGPPVPVTALAGNHQVIVSWPTPSTNGGAIQHYDVTWNGGNRRVTGNTTTVTGLTNNKSYSFSVTATNRYGTSPPAMSQQVTPTSKVPDTPTNVTAVVAASGADAGRVTVSWKSTYQADNYLVQPDDGSAPQSSTDTSLQMANLTPGQQYTFTVIAQGAGSASSAKSAPSNPPVTPFGPPGQPGGLKVMGTTATSVTVSWTGAAANGSPISGYGAELDGTPVGGTIDQGARSYQFTGLTAGQSHQLGIRATNAAGPGEYATITGGALPPAPTIQLSSTGSTETSVTIKATVSGTSIQTCTVTLNGKSWNCSGGGTHDFTGLYASSSYTASGTIKDTYGQSGADNTSASTSTVSTINACKNAQTNCSVGIYPDSNQQGNSVGEWIVGTPKTVVCKKTGQDIFAYNQNGNRDSNVWLKITSPSGYVPWSYSNMSTGTRDALPTC